jgi:hypothetical protein
MLAVTVPSARTGCLAIAAGNVSWSQIITTAPQAQTIATPHTSHVTQRRHLATTGEDVFSLSAPMYIDLIEGLTVNE